MKRSHWERNYCMKQTYVGRFSSDGINRSCGIYERYMVEIGL